MPGLLTAGNEVAHKIPAACHIPMSCCSVEGGEAASWHGTGGWRARHWLLPVTSCTEARACQPEWHVGCGGVPGLELAARYPLQSLPGFAPFAAGDGSS